jgi:hypothetical protein
MYTCKLKTGMQFVNDTNIINFTGKNYYGFYGLTIRGRRYCDFFTPLKK